MKGLSMLFLVAVLFSSCNKEKNRQDNWDIAIDSVSINNISVNNNGTVDEIDFARVEISINFTAPTDTSLFIRKRLFFSGSIDTLYNYRFGAGGRTLYIRPSDSLNPLTKYRFLVDAGPNLGGVVRDAFSFVFITRLDTTPKFSIVSEDSLLTLVQKQTFRYFHDYAHPVSGMTRERLGSGDIVTSGGSGFGLMAILTGIERNFITRQEGFEQFGKIVEFLRKSDRFHGAFPHWMNGATGKVYPFSQTDNGGDLVETALLMQGLLTVREYFRNGSPEERSMCDTITKIWEGVEWNWYRNNGQNRLFWHWSVNYAWQMNMPVAGWNEALIVYILAASSPTHSIPVQVYDEGWAGSGSIRNGKSFYNINLPLGEDYGGPLFFAHYSFLGLDPRNLSDRYAGYWDQNVSHTLINYNYCVSNPLNKRGYGPACWGLTASDIPQGYSASSPLNDLGVIAPTASISSIPYTPEESMRALKYFYYILGDRMWGEYGFHDAFDLSRLWFAGSYIAIDQGPIICMIENYRTGLLWNLFMKSEDIRNGLGKLGFTY